MKENNMLSTIRFAAIPFMLALSACGAPSTPNPPNLPNNADPNRSQIVSRITDLFEAPTSAQINITGAADMNGGTPARVKVYYLNSTAAFQSADFFAVFDRPEETLGADLIAVEEFQLAPGRNISELKGFEVPPAAIGVVAAFRDINGQFLAVKPVIPNSQNPVQVTLSGNTVTIR
jgi:type VI secretion system protein VasD